MMSLFDSATKDWRPPEEIPHIPPHVPVAVDIETRDYGIAEGSGAGWPWRGGFVVGLAVAWPEQGALRSIYFPFRHKAGGNVAERPVLAWLSELFRNNLIVVFNAAYDFGWLGMVPDRFHDVAIMAPLLDEYLPSYSLQFVSETWLGKGKETATLEREAASLGIHSAISQMDQVPSWLVDRYARRDAELTLELHRILFPRIRVSELEEPFNTETKILRLIIGMRAQGIRVNELRLQQLIEEYEAKGAVLRDAIHGECGHRIEPWVASDVAKALRATGVTTPLTPTGAPSIRKEWLVSLSERGNRVAALVLQLRQVDKLLNTFLKGYFANNVRNGRVHPEFHSLRTERRDGSSYGTVSYRFSCSNPNFQNLPGREDQATRDIRGLVLPEEGEQWIAGDYSQQEPRLALHYAVSIRAPGAEAALKRLLAAGDAWDFHSDAAAIVGIPRKQVKGISLGRMYGAGGVTIAKLLGLPTKTECISGREVEVPGEEAARLLRQYDEKFPWIRFTSDYYSRLARERGYLVLLGGYLSRFATGIDKPLADHPHKAFNRLVQGSAAAQTKRAMLLYAERSGRLPLITLHDEIGVSGDPAREGVILSEALRDSFAEELKVPFRADIETGPTWGAAALGEHA